MAANLLAAYPANSKATEAGMNIVEEPTEEMCGKARWFILARDANIFTWGGLSKCVYSKTIPYIEDKMENDPLGHITKWDVAYCVYLLMTTQIEVEAGSRES